MPLTRRVQVYIGEDASVALDTLTELRGSQRAAIEHALLADLREQSQNTLVRDPSKAAVIARAIACERTIGCDLGAGHSGPCGLAGLLRTKPAPEKRAKEKTVIAETLHEGMSAIAKGTARPHTFHSGTSPIAGCAECAGLVK